MGIETPSEGFTCDIYIPRVPANRDWICNLCHLLWRYGVRFAPLHQWVGTWEEQLHLRAEQGPQSRSLSDKIDDIVKYGSGSVICFDHNFGFYLNIDTNLRGIRTFINPGDLSSEQEAVLEQSSLGKLQLFVIRAEINVDYRIAPDLPIQQVPTSAYLIPPYQQIHIAIVHWVELLCLHLRSTFAIGYYNTRSYLAADRDFLYAFDLAMIAALEQQQIPPLQRWLDTLYILYMPAQLKGSPQTEEWLSSKMMWKRPLPDGSAIAYTMPETLEEIRVKDLHTACEKLLAQRDRSQLPLARIYLQRAQEIEEVAHLTHERYETNRLLEQIEYMEQHPAIFFP